MRGLRSFFLDLKNQVINVTVFREVRGCGILQISVNPAINGGALGEIWIRGGAELTIASVRLFFAMRLAMIGIHQTILCMECKSFRVSIRAHGSSANSVKRIRTRLQRDTSHLQKIGLQLGISALLCPKIEGNGSYLIHQRFG